MPQLSTITPWVVAVGLLSTGYHLVKDSPLLAITTATPTAAFVIRNYVSDTKRRNLTTYLTNLERNHTQATNDLAYAQQRLLDLQATLNNSITERDTLTKTLENARKQAKTLVGKLSIADEVNNALNAKIEALTATIEQLESRLKEKDTIIDNLSSELAEVSNTVESLQQDITATKRDLESAKLTRYELEELTKGKYEIAYQQRKFEVDQKLVVKEIQTLKEQLTQAQHNTQVLTNRHDADLENALKIGQETAEKELKQTIENLRLQVKFKDCELTTLKKQALFDSRLKSVGEIFTNDWRSIVASGEPRSGKAMIILSLLEYLSKRKDLDGNNVGVIPIVFDPSEGNDPNSSWGRLGIPVLNDFSLLMECLESIDKHVHSRPILHDPLSQNLSPIFVILDESKTALNGQSKETSERFNELFNKLKNETIKRKVVAAITATSYQIQNLKAGKVSLFNSGELQNTHLFLNNTNIQKFYRDYCKKTDELNEWIDMNQNQYTTAYANTNGAEVTLTPIRHPTHHGNLRSDKVANTPIDNIVLANIDKQAAWLPESFKRLYKNTTQQGCNKGAKSTQNFEQKQETLSTYSKDAQNLKPLPDTDSNVSAQNVAPPNYLSFPVDVSLIDDSSTRSTILDKLRDLKVNKTPKTKALKAVFGLNPSGKSKRYLKASSLFDSL